MSRWRFRSGPKSSTESGGGRTAVITMAMKRDFPHAAVSLASLEGQLTSTTQHLVLINDEPDAALERQIAAHPYRHVLSAGKNLGVPGGRNLLLREALEWGADRVVVFDDDLIAPSDYLERLTGAHRRLTSHNDSVGAIAPAVLNYGFVRENLLSSRARMRLDRQTPGLIGPTQLWRRRLQRLSRPLLAGEVEHLGIRDWEHHYLNVGSRALDRWWTYLGGESVIDPHQETVLANSETARKQVGWTEPQALAVDTIPGGVWCIGRAALESVGLLDTAFSPFGFEDADWCITAVRMGFTNYCVPDVLVAHDYQERLISRAGHDQFWTRGRSRAILIRKHASAERLMSESLQTMLELFDTQRLPHSQHAPARVAYGRGLLEGLRRETQIGDVIDRLPESMDAERRVDLQLRDVHFGSPQRERDYASIELHWVDQPEARTVGKVTVRWPGGAYLGLDIAAATTDPAICSGKAAITLRGTNAVTESLSLLGVSNQGLQLMLGHPGLTDKCGAFHDVHHALIHIIETDCQGELRIEFEADESQRTLVTVHHDCPVAHDSGGSPNRS